MERQEKKVTGERLGTFGKSCAVLLTCMGIIMAGIIILGLEAHIPILLATVAASVYGLTLRIPLAELEKAMIRTISESIGAIIILLVIGALIAAWMACGTVPYIVYLGLTLIDPAWFPMCVVLLCALLGLITGSAWTTTGTLGVSFVGIAVGLGIPVPLVAGAVVCGAFFGDKCSPISSFANFDSSLAGVNIYRYTKTMMVTNLPALSITCVIFAVLGRQYGGAAADTAAVRTICDGLAGIYHLSPVLWLPLVVILVMIVRKVPALPALTTGMLLGVGLAVFYQGMEPEEVLSFLYSGFSVESGLDQVDQILNRGGMTSMMSTMALVICALAMAGVFERTRMLSLIVQRMSGLIRKRTGLMIVTMLTSVFVGYFAADPFVAALVAVKAYQKQYEKLGMDPTVLTRTVADGAVSTCPLVPWGSSGVFASRALGVSVGTFLPYYFMGFLPLLLTVLSAVTGIGIRYTAGRSEPDERQVPPSSATAG